MDARGIRLPGLPDDIDLKRSIHRRMLVEPSPTPPSGALHAQKGAGWQPSRFLTDRAEAERAFALAEELGSVNAAAKELNTTWPSLRKAFQRHGLGKPARNPDAVRQRAIDAARQRTGRSATPSLVPVFAALNPGALPARPRSPAELYEWVRCEEQYATLGANVVVELYSESRTRQPTTRLGDHPPERPRLPAGWPARQPPRPPPHRPSRPHQPVPATPGAGMAADAR